MSKTLLIWTIKDLVYCIDSMLKKDFDCVIFIEGKRSLGKSTLAYKIALNCRSLSKLFNPYKDILYKRYDVLQAIARRYHQVIFADELVNIAYKRDFYEKEQKDLIKALNMYRDNLNLFIGCIPRFVDLDTDLQGICKIRITVVRRGVALIHRQVPSIYTRDPWDVKNNQKIEAKFTTTRTKNPKYVKLTTVIGLLRFGDLRPQSKRIYLAIKKEKRNQILSDEEELARLQDPEVTFYNNLFERVKKRELTPKILREICLVNNKKYNAVRDKLNAKLKEIDYNYRLKDFISFNNNVRIKDTFGIVEEEVDD